MELSVDRLTKHYGRKIAVDCVSTVLQPGVYGLLGENGAGKTTFMRMLCAILESTSGEVFLDGREITSMGADYRDVLGYLPQEFGYYPNYKAEEFLRYMAALKGIPRDVAKKRVKELLEIVDLSDVKGKRMKTFSGGMKQRVGIAQAMLNNPKVLVLDEPTAGLDPNERIRFRNLISELAEDRLVLLSTHIVSDVEFIANRIMLMKSGKIFYQGTTEKLLSSMDESVWHCTVPKREVNDLVKRYLVGNVKSAPGGAELRILAKEPPAEQSVREEATLEDAFLLYFGEKVGGTDDTEI